MPNMSPDREADAEHQKSTPGFQRLRMTGNTYTEEIVGSVRAHWTIHCQ